MTTSASSADPVNVSIYGKTIPYLFGTTKNLCAPLWTGPVQNNPDGSRTFSVAYVVGKRAPLVDTVTLYSVWINDVLVWDRQTALQAVDRAFYGGGEGQGAPAEIVAAEGIGTVPAFRDRIYFVIKGYTVPAGQAFPVVSALVQQSLYSGEVRYVTPYARGNYGTDTADELYYSKEYALLIVVTNSRIKTYSTDGKVLLYDVAIQSNPPLRNAGCISKTGAIYYANGGDLDTGINNLFAWDCTTGNKLAEVTCEIAFCQACTYPLYYSGPMHETSGSNVSGFYDYIVTVGIYGGIKFWRYGDGQLHLQPNSFQTPWGLTNAASYVVLADTSIDNAGRYGANGFDTNHLPFAPVTRNWIVGFAANTNQVIEFRVVVGPPSALLGGQVAGRAINDPNTLLIGSDEATTSHVPVYPFIGSTYGDKNTTIKAVLLMSLATYTYTPPGLATRHVGPLTDHTVSTAQISALWCSEDGATVGVVCTYVYTDGSGGANTRYVNVLSLTGQDHYEQNFYREQNENEQLSSAIGATATAAALAAVQVYYDNAGYAYYSAKTDIVPCTFVPNVVMNIPKGQSIAAATASGSGYNLVDLFNGNVTHRDKGHYADATNDDLVYDDSLVGTGIGGGMIYDSDKYVYYYKENIPDLPGEIKDQFNINDVAELSLVSLLQSYGILAGFTLNQIVVNGVTDYIVGSIINQNVSFVDVVGDICQLFSIDIFESAGQLHFNKHTRGTSFMPTLTVTQVDLAPVDQSSTDDGTLLTKDRDSTATLPVTFEVDYQDSDNDYQVGAQQAKRTQYPYKTSSGLSPTVLSVPLAMQAKEALYYVTVALYDQWAQALKLTGLTSIKNLAIEPGDIVEIQTTNDGTYIVKALEVYLNQDWSISFIASTISTEIPATSVDTVVTVNQPDPAASLDTFKAVTVENVSAIAFDGKTPSALFAGVSNQPVSFTLRDSATGAILNAASSAGGANFGFILNSHPAAANYEAEDNVSFLHVRLDNSTLPTIGNGPEYESYFQRGQMWAIIGKPTRWEIIYYRTITANADGTFNITGLVRGRHGSDAFMASQAAGDTIILMTGALPALLYTPYDSSDTLISSTAIQVGRTSTVSEYITPTWGSLKPWSPVDIAAAHSGSDIVITWVRRDRFETDLLDTGDDDAAMTLSETSELYDLEILNNAGNVVRTVSSLTAPTYTYLAADQTTDAFTGSVLKVNVYQRSSVVGRGFKGYKACPVT